MGKSSQKEKREKRLAGRVSLALAAGMFSVVPVAHGMPTLDKIDTGAVKFDGATPNPGDVLASGAPITSDTKNNIIDWKDFSVAQGEHVNFADDNNYMNVVTGKATSAIDGILSSNGGDIYVINPNGVIFGKTAQVNVGNLYVSTRALTTDVKNEFLRGNSNTVDDGNGNPVASPICTPFSDVLTAINNNTASATADVVNLIDKNGYVAANKVVMEGKNIRFLNTDSVAKYETLDENYAPTGINISGNGTDGFQVRVDKDGNNNVTYDGHSDITLRANSGEYIHVGDERNKYNSSTAHYTSEKVDNGSADLSVVDYTLIHNASELQAINNNKSGANIVGNYMLANDINDATITKPIGTASASGPTKYNVQAGDTAIPFTGKFDGMFFTVERLAPTGLTASTSYAGLFAYTKGKDANNKAVIENVGVYNADVKTGHAGGIVGYADNTTLRNVWNASDSDNKQIGSSWSNAVGGLVGVAANKTEIESSYNAGKVAGAGLVGTLNGANIYNSYNTGNVLPAKDSNNVIVGIFSKAYGENEVKNTYTAALFEGGASGGAEVNYITVNNTSADKVTWGNNYIIRSDTKYNKDNASSDTTVSNTKVKSVYSDVNNSGFDITDQGGIDADGKSHTWRIYEGSSLPMLTAFFRGTVSADYAYNDNGTEKFSSAAKNKTYDANMVNPYHYVSAEGGDYVYRDTEGYVRYDEDVDNADAPRYARQDGAHYLGMNATGTKGSTNGGGANVTITESDNKNAGTFALFKGQQQGYDLCDNYFTIKKRNIKFDLKNGSADKVYDGLSENVVSGKGLVGKAVNADDASLPAIVEIADGVLDDVKVGGTVTYVYKTNGVADKNVGNNKKVTITASGLKLEGASKDNYNATFIEPTADVDAKITKRTLQVGLYNTSGINKTYDGTSAVTNENRGELAHGFIGAENLDTSTATNVDGDEAWLTSQNRTIAQMLSDDGVGFNTSGVTSRYVKADLTTDAVNVADAAKVAYEGITLTGSDAALQNYQLSNGGKVYADGTINRRSISLSDFSYSSTGEAITKTYDGTSTMNDASKAGHAVTVLNQVSQDPTAEISTSNTTKGLLQADADEVKFITTGAATFYKEDGTTPAMDATDSGLAYAAKKAGYGVQLDTANLTEEAAAARRAVAANYIVEGVKIDEVDSSGANKSFDVMGEGRIEKRMVTVKLGQDTGIDKIYDGTTDVDDQYKTWKYAGDSENDTKKQLVTTGDDANKASIAIVYAKYDTKDVALDTQGEVLRGTDGNEQDNTKNVTFKLALGGDKAANYVLKTEAAHQDDTEQQVTLNATGKIKQRELNVIFDDVKKVYDGYTDVTNKKADTITPRVEVTGKTGNGLAEDEVSNDPTDTANFIFALSGKDGIKGTYGNGDTDATFKANKDVTPAGTKHDVQYTNLQTAIKSKNYKVSNTAYGKGIIQKKTIKSQDIDAATDIVNHTLTKVYDGNDKNTDYNGQNAISGTTQFLKWKENDDTIPDKDTLTITIADAVYNGKDADVYTGGVTMKFTVTGRAAGNYEFEGTNSDGTLSLIKTGYDGKITRRAVAASFNDPNPTKEYDGTTTLKKADGTTIDAGTIKDWFTPGGVAGNAKSGIVDGEDVVLQVILAQYKDPNQNENATEAQKSEAVRYTLALADGTSNKASNYTLVDTDGNAINYIDGVGTINKRTVYVTSVDNLDKVYDGNGNVLGQTTSGIHLAAKGVGSEDVSGLLSGEGLDVLKPVDANAASGVKGQYGDLVGSTFTANTAGNVKGAEVEQDIEYTGIDAVFENLYKNYKLSKDLSGDYVKKDNSNHTLVYGKGKISAAIIDLSGAGISNGISKEYDGTTAISKEDAKGHLIGVDDKWLSLLDISGDFDTAEHGEGKSIAVTIALINDSTLANNYKLSGDTNVTTVNGMGEIYAKKLYARVFEGAVADKEKEYDGNANVKDALANNITSWVKLEDTSEAAVETIAEAGGDAVKLKSGISAQYVDANYNADKNAADEKTILFSGITLADASNANYTKGNYTLVLLDAEGGNEVEKLTTTGRINKKKVNLTLDFGNITKEFNNSATISETNKANARSIIEAAVTTWKNANLMGDLATDKASFGVETGQLTGKYGSWDPDSKNFTTDVHVHRNADKSVKENTHDVLYYGFQLADAVSGNYELENKSDYTVDNVSANNLGLGSTVYFQEARTSGTITPLAITMDKVKEKWENPVTKVYDGNASIGSHGTYKAYDVDGNELPDVKKYLTIYYDGDNNGTYTDVETNPNSKDVSLTYSVTSAKYDNDNANAGAGKSFTFSGFSFVTGSDYEIGGDYTVADGALEAKYAAPLKSTEAKDYTKTPDANTGEYPVLTTTPTGTIARRLVNVTEDGVAHNKIYNGNTAETQKVIAAGTKYTATATNEHGGIENPTEYTGLVANDKAYITYEANYVNSSGAKDANVAFDTEGNVTAKDVVYTFTLAGDNAANYTLDKTKQTIFDGSGMTSTDKQTDKSTISQREVYVDFADGNTGFDKMYDNDSKLFKDDGTSLLDSEKTMAQILTLKAAVDEGDTHTGVVASDADVGLDYTKVKANYVDSSGAADEDVATTTSGRVTTKKVYFQNLMLTGSETQRNNYIVKAKGKSGNQKASATNAAETLETLEGSGTIRQRTIDFVAVNTPVNKTYDGNAYADYYYDADGKVKFNQNNVTVRPDGVVDGSYGLADGDQLGDLNLEVTGALYYDGSKVTSDAKEGLGVTYTLKFNNTNYNLVRTPIAQTTGTISKRELTKKIPTVDEMSKTYDGNKNITQTVSALAGELLEGYLAGDENGLIEIDKTTSGYTHEYTGAAPDSIKGAEQTVTINYNIANNNYKFSDGSQSGTYIGTGRIDRAPLTLVPTPVTYKTGDTIPTEGYAGTVTGFKNGENLADGYDVTFGRDANRATTIGNYNLLGYVNDANGTLLVPDANGFMYYNNPNGTTGNYYFVQQANNGALHIVPQESDMANAVQEAVIGDKKFTPDDYSYNRMSKDQDLTRVNRQSSATVQYAEKGVNVDEESRSGLAALADIQGAGSVVNLAGAVIQTSAPSEQPETVAAEAALPMPEPEETDNSSIALEYASEGEGSQELLEILTNASRKAENKGTSIVINAQDEDEQEEADEEEKNRRALFADRSNIGIETLGDAVNLNRMIG